MPAAEHSGSNHDVLLHLGNLGQELPELPAATYGTWTVRHDELTHRIEEAVMIRRPLLWVHLWNLQAKLTGSPQRVGSHSLPMQTFSISDALSYGFGSLPSFITSRLTWLANGVCPEEYESGQICPESFPSYAYPCTYLPPHMSSIEYFARALLMVGLQIEQRLRDYVLFNQWQLGFRFQSHHASDVQLSDFYELKPPRGTIWADPHLIVEDNKTHIFFEELEINENHGRIAWGVLTPEGFAEKPKTVLSQSHHLSYPFVFKHEGEIYMVPETAAQNSICLYKAAHFPEQWEHVGSLIEDINAADSTLFQHGGLWWLFTNGVSHRSVDERDQLLLFYSDDLLSGNWQPHPLNPVVTGVDRARMAGPIYQKNGELFRPSQYGATRYGFGVNISSIQTLSKTEYQETLQSRLSPNLHDVWIGCHTALHGENVTMVDRLRRVWR